MLAKTRNVNKVEVNIEQLFLYLYVIIFNGLKKIF